MGRWCRFGVKMNMTEEETLKEVDMQEKRIMAEGFRNGLRLAKSTRRRYQTIMLLIVVSSLVPNSPASGWPIVRHFDKDHLYLQGLEGDFGRERF